MYACFLLEPTEEKTVIDNWEIVFASKPTKVGYQ